MNPQLQFLNLIIANGNVRDTDRELLFPDNERVDIVFPGNQVLRTMFDILVFLGVFKSKSDARKNWKKTRREIPPGFSHFVGLGKFRKELCIWNPTER